MQCVKSIFFGVYVTSHVTCKDWNRTWIDGCMYVCVCKWVYMCAWLRVCTCALCILRTGARAVSYPWHVHAYSIIMYAYSHASIQNYVYVCMCICAHACGTWYVYICGTYRKTHAFFHIRFIIVKQTCMGIKLAGCMHTHNPVHKTNSLFLKISYPFKVIMGSVGISERENYHGHDAQPTEHHNFDAVPRRVREFWHSWHAQELPHPVRSHKEDENILRTWKQIFFTWSVANFERANSALYNIVKTRNTCTARQQALGFPRCWIACTRQGVRTVKPNKMRSSKQCVRYPFAVGPQACLTSPQNSSIPVHAAYQWRYSKKRVVKYDTET